MSTISIECGKRSVVYSNRSKTKDVTVNLAMNDKCESEAVPQYQVLEKDTIKDEGSFDSKQEVITVDVPHGRKLIVDCAGSGHEHCEVDVTVA